MPADLRYAFSNFERQRINAQGVLQFAPTDALTLTLDYTHSTNEIAEDRGEQTQWLNQGPFSRIEFDTSGPLAVPTYIREIVGTKDFGYEQQRQEQKYKLDSIGFNATWQATDRDKFRVYAEKQFNGEFYNGFNTLPTTSPEASTDAQHEKHRYRTDAETVG